MDPVSAVASVVGIIGFVGQGIKTIGELKKFCAEFSVDATQDFLCDLQVTAVVLMQCGTWAGTSAGDIRTLCFRQYRETLTGWMMPLVKANEILLYRKQFKVRSSMLSTSAKLSRAELISDTR